MNGLATISPSRFDCELFGPNALDLLALPIKS
jgi:hypothetical protein